MKPGVTIPLVIAIAAAAWTACNGGGGSADGDADGDTLPDPAGEDADAETSDPVRDDIVPDDGTQPDDTPAPDGDLYEPVEYELTAAIARDNPYVEITVTAEITPPAGSGEDPYTIPGFWDGGDTWRVRWAPRRPGTYRIRVTCSDTSDTGLHGRVFTYTANDVFSAEWAPSGFVGIDPETTYYFVHDDGTKFLWVGDTNWINLYEHAWDQPLFSDGNWGELVARRAEYGFTVLQAVVYNTSESWDDGERPFAGGDTPDPDVVNPLSWQRVDTRVQAAVRGGLVMYLMTSSDGHHFDWGEEQRERLYRYIVARYAAYNVAFGGGEEVDRGGYGTDEKYRHMIDRLHALDPYRRMVGLHATGRGTILVPDDVDMLLIQYYTSDIEYETSYENSRPYGKPYVCAETWYFDSGNPGMDDPVTIRRMAWRIFLGGAAGYTYGHMGIVVSSGSSHPGGYDMADLTDGSAAEMRTISRWLGQSGLAWWAFTRFENLGSGRYLSAAPGRQYVIYTEDSGEAFTADLSDASGTLTGEWFDIAADASAGSVSVEAGASVDITPPGPWHVLRLDAP